MTFDNPEIEWIQAAWADNSSYHAFRKRSVAYQERIIAAHRIQQQVAAVIAHSNRPKRRPAKTTPRSSRFKSGRRR